MNNGPIILTEQGSRVFYAYDKWHDYCRENNIADPWRLEEKIRDEYTRHYETIDEHGMRIGHIDWDEPTDDQKRRLKECHDYRDKYMIDREEWVANFLFENFGYDALTNFAQTHLQEKSRIKIFGSIKPCEGPQGQCAFDCPIFNNCPEAQLNIKPGVEI